ncbi:MAG: sarcosine oxidase subunit alpha family protein [Pseudomonadota bacterium]
MAGSSFRLPSGGAIDRSSSLSFEFDGKSYRGFQGDTLASALMANGVRLFGRSFKYHRPRGIIALGSAEPNALVEMRGDARREPNIQATMVELYDGLVARSQNRFPSLRWDVMAVNQLASPFLQAGFYYKTFMWPASFWEPVYEKLIRRAAGLGRAAEAPDPDHYEHTHAHPDVLVIGAGATGLSAATKAAETGARVMVLDEHAALGGWLNHEDGEIDGAPYKAWLDRQVSTLETKENVEVLKRTSALGLYDDNMVLALERVSDHLPEPLAGCARQRLWIIRPQKIIVAAGAIERPLTFVNNDKPGVMLASAAQGLARCYGVAPGKRIIIATNNDGGHRTALTLQQAGIDVAAVADARETLSLCAEESQSAGIAVHTATMPQKALGGVEVSGVRLRGLTSEKTLDLDCDVIAMAGGLNPNIQLLSQGGKRPLWQEDIQAFTAEPSDDAISTVGACRGIYNLAACVEDGRLAGEAAARDLGLSSTAAPSVRIEPSAIDIAPVLEAPKPPGTRGKAFVDFQNDVTAGDIRLAVQEGYESVEHLKRYTTLGMATDQGKLANVNGLAVLADARNEALPDVGVTRFRPPYTPTSIGAFAGHHRGKTYQPIRRTAMHSAHEECGATFVEAGQWLRPRYYARPGEDMLTAIKREATAVRASLGVCDVSTLGKIDVFGPDAAEFLNRIYINNWLKLPVGKARYGVMLREDGHLFDDGTTSRLSDDHFFVTCTTANAGRVLAHMEHASQVLFPELDVVFCSATEQWCGVALAGPNSRAALSKLVDGADVSNDALPFMGVTETTIEGVPARLFRISFSGELAYEINVPWGAGNMLWRRIMEVGAEFDITPYGTEALSVLRIEKGHIAGSEIDGRTTAADAGLGRMMAKKAFIGKAMANRPGLTAASRPALVGVKPISTHDRLRGGAHFVAAPKAREQESLGWVSSTADSPAMKGWIGLGFLKGGTARIGERLFATYPLKDEMVEIEICSPIFVDPEGERVRG